MEETPLFRLIRKATGEAALRAAGLVSDMDDDDVQQRSARDHSTFLHQVVLAATDVYRREQVSRERGFSRVGQGSGQTYGSLQTR